MKKISLLFKISTLTLVSISSFTSGMFTLFYGLQNENYFFKNNSVFYVDNVWRSDINEIWIKKWLYENKNDVFENLNLSEAEFFNSVEIKNIDFNKFPIGIINFDLVIKTSKGFGRKKITLNLSFNDIIINNIKKISLPHSKHTSLQKTNTIMSFYEKYPKSLMDENNYFLRLVYGLMNTIGDYSNQDIIDTIKLIKNDINNPDRMTKIVKIIVDIKLPINSLLYNQDDKELHQYIKTEMKHVLDDFFTNYYFINQSYVGNWWNYDIGIPRRFAPILIFLKDYFDFSDVEKWVNIILWHTRNYEYWTGGNLLDYTYLRTISFIVLNNIPEAKKIVNYSIDKIFGGWKDVDNNSSFSFYRDGSYLEHDDVPYFGGYGVVLLDGFDKLRAIFQNSPYQIETNSNIENFYKMIEVTIMPYFFDGVYTDSLGGRSITRFLYKSERKNGMKILDLISHFAYKAPINYKDRLVNFILDNLESDVLNDYLTDSLIEFSETFHEKVKIQDRKVENTWNELNLFTNDNNLFGIDLFTKNNNMWFAKNQDRFTVKRNNFMFNISLSSTRTKNFEMINKENIFGYYFNAGRTLINPKNSNETYDWLYNLGVDPFKIPGTSSVYEFDNQNMTDDAILARFNDYYSVARNRNKGFANGISLDGYGMISANINNYNSDYELWTRKKYVIIDDYILVFGNVNRNNVPIENDKELDVITTISNEMDSKDVIEKKVTVNEKEFYKYLFPSKNNYYVLNNSQSIIHKKVTRKLNNLTSNMTNEPGFTNFTFNELYFNHSKNKVSSFAYLIAPNEQDENTGIEIINNINFSINDGYLMSSYKKGDSVYYFVSTTNNNQHIIIDSLDMMVEEKISFIFKKTGNNIKMVMSSNENLDSFKIWFNKPIGNIFKKNNNEIEYNSNYIIVNNTINKLNDIMHNSWIEFNVL